MHAPASYGYNGRTGSIAEISGTSMQVFVDEHPIGMRCTTFYAEELERETPPQESNNRLSH